MKIIIFILLTISPGISYAFVDWAGTSVIPHNYGPTCLANEYVTVGFSTNFEINNASFEIQRSTDPNFSSSIVVGGFGGCGTCGGNQYSIDDYGPFNPNETWYYRARALSTTINYTYHDLGSYTTNVPTTINWINQVTHTVMTGSTPSTEASYTWNTDTREMQGVNISLMPTEIAKIYLEQGNNKINFLVHPSCAFVSFDVDVDNSGYSNIYNGSPITNIIWNNSSTALYSFGYHDLKVRFTAINGTQYIRAYNVYVVPASDGFYVDNYCNTMRVWKGNNISNPTPLILSEGFDGYNTKSEQYYRYAGKDLIDCLLSKGFDVYVVNYNLNAQSIKNNAAVYQSATRYISNLYGGEKVVASGMSMGGVINRYACAKAENDGNPLPILKFVTLDAPHQGAVIARDFQDWRKSLLDESTQNGFPDPFSEFASNNEAAKELLISHAYDPGSTVHTNFFNDLNSLNGDGYPHLVEKIGITFSTISPNPNSGQWIYVHLTGAPNFGGSRNYSGYLTSDELVAGSYLPSLNIDGFPAISPQFWLSTGLSILRPISNPWVTITQYTDPTFIPHNSSLDIVNNVSAFDQTLIPSVTGYHDVIPAELVEPIVNALIEKTVYVQDKTYNNTTRTIIASEKIIAGNNVTTNYPVGDVIIGANANITFKAGEEIHLEAGFEANPEFRAIITPVQCDGSTEYQNRQIVTEESIIDNLQIYTHTYELESSNSASSRLNLYPNPNMGNFYLSIISSEDMETSLSILDLSGRIVHSQILSLLSGGNTIEILKPELPSGVYFINVGGFDEPVKMVISNY